MAEKSEFQVPERKLVSFAASGVIAVALMSLMFLVGIGVYALADLVL